MKTILTLAFALFACYASAQNTVYDYLTVNYSNNYALKVRQITITSNGMPTEAIDMKKTESKDFSSDLQEFFKRVQEMEAQGWSLFDTDVYVYSTSTYGTTEYVWVMRKPKH
ncbi:MAG: hypothetical protein IPL81_06800 [Flavobacteriales bacterium]|nr:hypothetical protein [Flavobacteriales bacterium]MBK7248234.1 hypothetical protein [Flavobacteriales bacterium]MBK9059579.1 hypothetical protein [Flavobacteriales bacterium]QQS73495.1 MAG: hypothetical protein IPP95_04525 [Flavobacteriales bacterium]HQV39143.1 hypothetical protein [Flavobacteriales bacterium]